LPLLLLLPLELALLVCHPVGICLVVILTLSVVEGEEPCICPSGRSEATYPQNKFQKTAKNPPPKTHQATNHLNHTIHHILSTKSPYPAPNFLKNPSKNSTLPQTKKDSPAEAEPPF
jgi:hypothetical protein